MVATTTLSEAFSDNNLLHLPNGAVPLDFASTPSIPDSHVWHDTSLSVQDLTSDEASFEIPTVDLNDPEAAKLIGQACEKWGVFHITNHEIPTKLLQEVEAEMWRLFSLPTAQKMKAARSPGSTTGYGVAKISQFFQKMMWHEGFTIIGSPVDHAKELWPHDYPSFCKTMEAYEQKVKELAKTLMHLILNFLKIQMNWIDSSTSNPATALQLNSYPPCPDPTRAMGLAPHTDTSLITILHQSGSTRGGSLQIFKEGVGWGSVITSPTRTNNSLVVNVGDFLDILSNGRFPCVVHRVVMKEPQQRLSAAYFYMPPLDFIVSPHSSLLDSYQIPRYRSVSVKEFVGMKNKEFDKALPLIKLTHR